MIAPETSDARRKLKWRDLSVLLLIVAVLATLALILGSSVIIVDRRAPTASAVANIQTAMEAYDTEYNEMPDVSNSARLITILSGANPRKIEFIYVKLLRLNSEGEVVDEWGTPLRISIDAHSKIDVESAGPDKIFGTPDDIVSQ